MASKRSENDRNMAAHLRARGIYHGKRMSSGLSNIPNISDVGSAAYRRLKGKKK